MRGTILVSDSDISRSEQKLSPRLDTVCVYIYAMNVRDHNPHDPTPYPERNNIYIHTCIHA